MGANVNQCNLEIMNKYSTWRYDENGKALKDKTGNEIAFLNQDKKESLLHQIDKTLTRTNNSDKEFSKLLKELKNKDISADDMYTILQKFYTYISDYNNPDTLTQLKGFMQEVVNRDYSKSEVRDLNTLALENNDKSLMLPQALRIADCGDKLKDLSIEEMETLNELAKNNNFLAKLIKDIKQDPNFDYKTWLQNNTTTNNDNQLQFKQTEYIVADDGRNDVDPSTGKSLVDTALESIKVTGQFKDNEGMQTLIKNYLSSENVPLDLLKQFTTIFTPEDGMGFVIDASDCPDAISTQETVMDAIQTRLNKLNNVKTRNEVVQTDIAMKYHDEEKAGEDIDQFFDTMLSTPDSLSDLDGQYRRVYGKTLDQILNEQYGNEFDANYKDTKSGEKYSKKKNEYITKHVQKFKSEFPELQKEFKDVYRNLKAKYDDFDNVMAELQKEDPEEYAKIKTKYGKEDGTIDKDLLYRDILTNVTGSDATVDRSRRTGFLGLGKSYGTETEQYARMHFFEGQEDSEIEKGTLKALGFGTDKQIDWGKVAKDAGLGAVLGVASLATFGLSTAAVTMLSEVTTTTITNNTTNNYVKTDILRDKIVQNGITVSPEELIEGTPELVGSESSTTSSTTTENGTPQKDKSRNIGRAAIGVGSLAILGALHSIVNQLKNNNEVDITNGWNGASNSAEILQPVTTAIQEYKATHQGKDFDAAEMRNVAAEALCKKLYGDGHDVDNYAQKHDLMFMITRFYIDDNGTFYAAEMAADCFSNSSNKRFSPDEAQALIAQLMQKGGYKPSQVQDALDPTVKQNVVNTVVSSNAMDTKVLQKNGMPVDFSQTQNRQISNKGDVKAQVVTSANGSTRIIPGDNDDYRRPKQIEIQDTTNEGYIHTFTYELCTPQDLSPYNLQEEDGKPFYKLISVTEVPISNSNNTEPLDIMTKHNGNPVLEIYRLELGGSEPTQKQELLSNGDIIETIENNYDYMLMQDENYPGSGRSAIDYTKAQYMRKRKL